MATPEFFRPGGALARVHERYEHRLGQDEMARAVAHTLAHGGTLMIEAGTGTGKTLAYLVPALATGRRVIVSTGTLNLQDQIYAKDIPFLRERVGLDVSACVMKGRDNYLCRYRMSEVEREPLIEDLGEAPWVRRIADWSRATASGDRAEIADLPDRLKLWRDVNARADTCTGSRCPEYEPCFLTQMKRKARDCQIVVVNHHLFFADLAVRSAYGAVLPDYDTVIFDEAHLLEEIATLYFGVQVSSAQLEDLARQAERQAARAGGPAQGGGGAGPLRLAAKEFFFGLRQQLQQSQGRVRFEPADRGGPDLAAEWAVLLESLDGVARQSASTEEGLDALPRRVDELRNALTQLIHREDPAYVHGMELRGRGNVVLTAAPIDVSRLLQVELFDKVEAAVLTSATLAIAGKFDFFQTRLGLADTECRVVDSSFDHARQAVLYLPQGMPEPSHVDFIPRAVAEIVDLLETTAGRAFLLFTSYANMQRVHDELARIDRWPLFLQGDGSKVALVESFRTTARAVLLGTTSFWHGVDVPGQALSLVVIDKLPFDVPSDPLIAARIERVRDQGGNPFTEYQVPLAVLELKQGLGRLLRSREDRGILAVLDPRLTSRRYGKTFLSSLPPYRIVRDRTGYTEFFRNVASADGAFDARARELATRLLIADTHIDVPYRLMRKMEDIGSRTEGGDFDHPRAREGGLDLAFMSIYVPASYQETGGARRLADELIEMVHGFVRRQPHKFGLVTSVAQARQGHGRVVGLAMGLENGAALEGDLDNVKYLHDRGIRYITLTHSENNAICDSSYAEARRWNGLSPFGREVVTEMNRLGMIIDVSHITDEAFRQVLELTRAPVLATHSSCRHFTPGWERNLSDEMIRRLAANGGTIHINFGSSFISDDYRRRAEARREKLAAELGAMGIEEDSDAADEHRRRFLASNPIPHADLSEVADHIDRVVALVGVDHVGIGSDFDGVGDSLPGGLEDVSRYPNLIAELLRRGYTEQQIERVCALNLLRVWSEAERIAREWPGG